MSQTSNGGAVVSYGATLQVKNPTGTNYVHVGGITDFNGPQTTRGEIDATTLGSAAKEYVLDLKDHGTFTSKMQTRLGDPGQKILVANLDSTSTLDFRLALPDDGLGNGEVTISFAGRVQSFPIAGALGQVISTDLSIRITSDVDIQLPTP